MGIMSEVERIIVTSSRVSYDVTFGSVDLDKADCGEGWRKVNNECERMFQPRDFCPNRMILKGAQCVEASPQAYNCKSNIFKKFAMINEKPVCLGNAYPQVKCPVRQIFVPYDIVMDITLRAECRPYANTDFQVNKVSDTRTIIKTKKQKICREDSIYSPQLGTCERVNKTDPAFLCPADMTYF